MLRKARKQASEQKRAQVYRAVDKMSRDGTSITFAAVARIAKVSHWLVYAEGVREYIEAARTKQDAAPDRLRGAFASASATSLKTDLELCRQDNRALRSEVTKLKNLLREQLGDILEAETAQTLRNRVDELTSANQRYIDEIHQLSEELDTTRSRLDTAETDLLAARSRLRIMIRDQTAATGQ
ncbi:DUF6262 family protein [Mycobacteroides abscessus]|uniref:DUF6262 family protein n=1 Tax=Mycobacteroides abscessus TaxID=36809 RepID=UPI001A98F905|nr:DUF6262 family protein [Mycobacteroides abscessus]